MIERLMIERLGPAVKNGQLLPEISVTFLLCLNLLLPYVLAHKDEYNPL